VMVHIKISIWSCHLFNDQNLCLQQVKGTCMVETGNGTLAKLDAKLLSSWVLSCLGSNLSQRVNKVNGSVEAETESRS